MKFAFTFLLAVVVGGSASAQVTTLTEQFESTCTTIGYAYPTNWSEYNNIEPIGSLGWYCAPNEGRFGTTGMEVSSFHDGRNYLDTAWLFTPQLNLVGYPGTVYVRFDAKYQHAANRLRVLVSSNFVRNGNPDSIGIEWDDRTASSAPVIDNSGDSAVWVTHWIDLTAFKTTPLYVAFKFVSSTSVGGTWTIDNVYTTPWGEGINDAVKETIPVTVIGSPTSDRVRFNFNIIDPGQYKLVVTDLLGREETVTNIDTKTGFNNYILENQNLTPGMHIAKLCGENSTGFVKFIVE